MSQACSEMTSPQHLAAAGPRRSGASRRDDSAPGRWSVGAVWAALATLAITLGACESPSSLGPATQSQLTIAAQGRLERGAAVQLQVMHNGAPVSAGDISWSTASAWPRASRQA